MLQIVNTSKNLNYLNILGVLRALPDIVFYDHQKNFTDHDDVNLFQWANKNNIDRTFFDIVLEPAASVSLNEPSKISAAEMLLMTHYYFIGHPRAFNRWISTVDHGRSVIDPWVLYLRKIGVNVVTGKEIDGLHWRDDRRIGIGQEVFDSAVLAADIAGLHHILKDSTSALPDDMSVDRLRETLGKLELAPPYHVLRVWFDKPVRKDRPDYQAVIETPEFRPINLLAIFDRLEEESRQWADATGGSIVEFHLYATPEFVGMGADAIWQNIKVQALKALPELSHARTLDFSLGSYENFTSFATGQGQVRPMPNTPESFGLENLQLAGDWVHIAEFPTALMERSVTSGRMAANAILRKLGVRQAPVFHGPVRGPGLLPRFNTKPEVLRPSSIAVTQPV